MFFGDCRRFFGDGEKDGRECVLSRQIGASLSGSIDDGICMVFVVIVRNRRA